MIEFSTPAVVAPDPEANATDLLVDRVAATPDLVLFSLPTADGGWSPVTTREFHDQVIALAKGLVAAGIQPGDKIGLMCKTRYEWTLIDFATWFAGAVLVPIYETSSPAQVQLEPHRLGCDRDHRRDRRPLRALRRGAPRPPADPQRLADRPRRPRQARRRRHRRRQTTRSNVAATSPSGSDIATLIYTSGSTGKPKGCVLTHSNFVELCRNSAVALKEVVADPGASTLLFITTAHVFARFISVLSVHAGVKVGHQADTKQLLPSLGSFKPTFLLAVPRVFEKVYNVAEQKAEAGGKGKIFRGRRRRRGRALEALEARSKVPFGLKVKFALFDRLVYASCARPWAATSSTPSRVRPRSARASATSSTALGITILEGYGLTETTAPATVNLADEVQDRHRRPDAARCLGAHRRRRRDPGQGHRRLRRSTGRTRRRRRSRSTASGSRPATSARSTTTATSRSPVARRRSSSRRAARTSPRPRSKTRSARTRSSARSSSSATRSRSSRR